MATAARVCQSSAGSTEGGDFRIPHFVGIHAINVLPFAAWALPRTRLPVRRQVAVIWIVSMGYLGLVGLLTWQALRGQSLIAPNGLTLLGAATLRLAVVGGVLAALAPRHALSPATAFLTRGLGLCRKGLGSSIAEP
jgi:hypothetical protein